MSKATTPNNTIGGTTAAARNIISGNSSTGVYLTGNNDVVEGDYIGTDITGSVVVANVNGVLAYAGNDTIGGPTATPGTGAGNVISGNTFSGIALGF